MTTKITIHKDNSKWFMDKDFTCTVLDKHDNDNTCTGDRTGAVPCCVAPWAMIDEIPLYVEIEILRDGTLYNKGWRWGDDVTNEYLHVAHWWELERNTHNQKPYEYEPTAEQIETVSGLISGRIKFEGLIINVGDTVQKYIPVDLHAKELRYRQIQDAKELRYRQNLY